MKINYAYILAAGKGTRMGEVGKKMPKPLWPIFSKPLLDLQVQYCRSLKIDKIFINTHYLANEINEHVKKNKNLYKDVVFLHEEPLLDSGGAIHNLAKHKDVNYTGNVLLLNADQFLLISQKNILDALSNLEKNRASLFGIKVLKTDSYNETKLKDNLLVEISKSNGVEDFWTYSGTGILKLDGLKPVDGISRFFESVCDYKNEKIYFVQPEGYEYWDFGTLPIYVNNILKIYSDIKNQNNSLIIEFLKNYESLENIDSFANDSIRSIDLNSKKRFKQNHLSFEDLIVEI